MKTLTALITCLFTFLASMAFGQSKPVARPMAKSGQEFWVCAYDVKPDKRTQYEHFVHDLFWPGAAKLAPNQQQFFRQTRVMHPLKANADGSYTYAFIMDPAIAGADYNIVSFVKKMYGASKGAEYYKLFEGALKKGDNYHEYDAYIQSALFLEIPFYGYGTL